MKKSFNLLAILSLVTFISISISSCSKITEMFPPIELEVAQLPLSIPMVMNIENNVETNATMNLKIDSIIKSMTGNQFSLSKVKSIAVKEMKLTLYSTDEQDNVANFENINVKLSSYSITAPTAIASASNIADTYANTLVLSSDASKNIKEYLADPSISFSLSSKARRTTSKELSGTLYMTVVITL